MKPRGYSIVEMLVTLAAVSVLFGLAVPGFADFFARQRSIAAVNQIIGAVNFARHGAVMYRTTTVLCPAQGSACARRNQWHLGAMVFKDHNADGVRSPQESIITQLPPLRAGERVIWRSFRNKSYLQFKATGLTSWQNGSFQYCPADADPRYSKSIIINAQGRATKSRDANKDGVDEDASGKPLRCP
jgi:type IV fimbrial biogenesis protein FimT